MTIFLCVFAVNCFYGTLFPIKYKQEIDVACESFSVDRAVVFAVINVESGFRKNAKSNKGAQGLMQILPSTAKELSKKCGIQDFDLFDEKDNITLGTFYLSTLIKRFDDLTTALCAYNAGPSKVETWLKNKEYSSDGKTIKKIPFPETEKYIKKIYKNIKYYSKK